MLPFIGQLIHHSHVSIFSGDTPKTAMNMVQDLEKHDCIFVFVSPSARMRETAFEEIEEWLPFDQR